MDINELLAAMKAIVDSAEAENRSLNDDEVTKYEGLEADLATARKTVEIRSRQNAYETPNISVAPITGTAKGDEVLERAFDHYLRTGQQNSDLVELRTQETGTPSGGGYLVPPGFRQKLQDRKVAYGGLASVAEVINTSSGNNIEWPTVDDTANLGEITAETSPFENGADLTFGTKTLGAFKYTSAGASDEPLRVSVELLQDSAFDVSAFVAKKLGERIARKQAVDYARGVGTTEPLGLMTTTNDVTSNTITYAKLLDVVHTVDPEYRANGKWIMNDTTLKGVRALVDDNSRPIWQSASQAGLGSMPGGELLGYAVVIDQACNVVASGVNFIAFGDFKESYIIRNVADTTVVVNPYSRANYGEVEYVAWARSDATIQNRYGYATLAGLGG